MHGKKELEKVEKVVAPSIKFFILEILLVCWYCYGIFRPPVCEVCPNYEVVVFKPRTLTPPHLGSCHLCLTISL